MIFVFYFEKNELLKWVVAKKLPLFRNWAHLLTNKDDQTQKQGIEKLNVGKATVFIFYQIGSLDTEGM